MISIPFPVVLLFTWETVCWERMAEEKGGWSPAPPRGSRHFRNAEKRKDLSLSIVCGKVFLSKFPRGGVGYRRPRQQPDFHDERKEDIFAGIEVRRARDRKIKEG